MDARTLTLIFSGFLLAAFSLATIGLAADNIAFIHQRSGDDATVDLHYFRLNQRVQMPYSYWVTMNYLPDNFTMGALYAMIVSCIVCLIAGTTVAVTAWRQRGEKTARSITSLVIASVAFIFDLAIAIYVWFPNSLKTVDFLKSLPSPPSGHESGPVSFKSQHTFTPESWNCRLATFAVEPKEASTLMNACEEAKATNYMMIPVLILSAALLAGVSWSWYSARRITAAHPEAGTKEMDEVSVESKN